MKPGPEAATAGGRANALARKNVLPDLPAFKNPFDVLKNKQDNKRTGLHDTPKSRSSKK